MAAMASGTVELNILAWNQMPTKYVKDGQPEKEHLKTAGLLRNSSFKVVVGPMFLWGIAWLTLYAKCGNIEGASRVFNKMPSSSVVTWTTMISGHVKHG
ncbi:unnamed protein product [Sphagnum troendelagicum]